MVDYCTAADIASFLQVTIDGTTQPTTTDVESRIEEAEDFIDEQTGHAFRDRTITEEYHDLVSGSGQYDYQTYDRGTYKAGLGYPVYLKHRVIRTLTFNTDKLEVRDGSTFVDFLDPANGKTEGLDQDFFVDEPEGTIYFKSVFPPYRKAIRVTYRYGETAVPKDIRKAAILLTSIDMVQTDDRSTLLPDGNSQSNFSSKTEVWNNRVSKILNNRIEFIHTQM